MNKRIRFDIFKRDDFTCRYCGKSSPDVILEVDHVVPKISGGSDDPKRER
jgi:5-methylcytosine-specific restriction endonuclease McrA